MTHITSIIIIYIYMKAKQRLTYYDKYCATDILHYMKIIIGM